jgi:hypothetical protein
MRTALRRAVGAVPGLVACATACGTLLAWLLSLELVRAVIALTAGGAPAPSGKDSPRPGRRTLPPVAEAVSDVAYGTADYLVLTPMPLGARDADTVYLPAALEAAVVGDPTTAAPATPAAAATPGGAPEGSGGTGDALDEPWQVELVGLPPGTTTLLSRELIAQVRPRHAACVPIPMRRAAI